MLSVLAIVHSILGRTLARRQPICNAYPALTCTPPLVPALSCNYSDSRVVTGGGSPNFNASRSVYPQGSRTTLPHAPVACSAHAFLTSAH